jgi:dipeptidase D
MSQDVRLLEPIVLWNHFADLNAVPRPSKKEERVIQFMMDFGKSLGLETIKDSRGNVIIKKPATPGMENRQTVILQSHLDMVHQKNSDIEFDFENQGIEMYVEGDWVKARGTTLGADNGIGVAAIMALLSSDNEDIKHPALEALFTVDEETGMTGAMHLDGSLLSGTILLNLDTEDDDELCIGCAGGIDTNAYLDYTPESAHQPMDGYSLRVFGLKGGHSGMDINKGRANANKLMNRLIYGADQKFGLRVASIDGGSSRNAIPRESQAYVVVNPDCCAAFEKHVAELWREFQSEFRSSEPDLMVSIEKTEVPNAFLPIEIQKKLVNAIYAVHNGVYRMHADIPGLVETSSSLARVFAKDGKILIQALQRSSGESTKMDVANTVRAALENAGMSVEQGGSYPGWQLPTESALLELMSGLYKEIFNAEPNIQACHAGLECGILSKHLPNTDMISFGPNIRHAHSPDECVQISSVKKFWSFLCTTLEEIPVR